MAEATTISIDIELNKARASVAKFYRDTAGALDAAAQRLDPVEAAGDGDTVEGLSAAEWKARRDIWFDCWVHSQNRADQLEARNQLLSEQLAEARQASAWTTFREAALRRLVGCAKSCRRCDGQLSHIDSLENDAKVVRGE